ncbi:MAG: hypothetical protein R2822_27035 [Spirosomataceae bacterium]
MANKLDTNDFRYDGKAKLNLQKVATKIKDLYDDKDDYAAQLEDFRNTMDELQSRMYAHGRYGLLVIFQAMDAAGKDGTIKHVLSG